MWVLQMGQATGYRTQAHADLTPKRSLLPPLYASRVHVCVCVFADGNRGIVIDRRPVGSHTLQHFHKACILVGNVSSSIYYMLGCYTACNSPKLL